MSAGPFGGRSPEQVAALLDRLEIEAVLARYARGVDRIDIPLIKSAFWPGAIDEHGTFNGPADAFADYLNVSLRRFQTTTHVISNLHIELCGDTAHVESYVTATHMLLPEDGNIRFTLAGRYIDRMERRDGEWRIAHRMLVMDWLDVPAHAHAVQAMLDKIERRGQPAPDDTWYTEGGGRLNSPSPD